MTSSQHEKNNIFSRAAGILSKNFRIIRIRLEIGRIERKQSQQYALLGNRLLKLIKANRLELPEQKKLVSSIEDLDEQLKDKSELLLKLVQSP
jgi:hypothetical protein